MKTEEINKILNFNELVIDDIEWLFQETVEIGHVYLSDESDVEITIIGNLKTSKKHKKKYVCSYLVLFAGVKFYREHLGQALLVVQALQFKYKNLK